MRGLRAIWWMLALLAVALTVWTGISPIAGVSMSCGKIGELHLDGAPASAGCDDSIFHVLGARPLVWLGLALAIPPMVAALVPRPEASWMAVAALVIVSIAGLANWASYWGMFLIAVPMAGLALAVALVQRAVRAQPA